MLSGRLKPWLFSLIGVSAVLTVSVWTYRASLNRREVQIAASTSKDACPAAEACPYSKDKTLLRNCTPPDADNTPDDSVCGAPTTVGSIFPCGGKDYCCPSAGAAWTTDLTKCPNATPSPSPSPSPSVSPSPSPSPSASPSSDASPEPSPSLSPDQAQFVVTKFFDANRNGFKDSNEGSVNREWLFKVSQNADPYYDYTAESTGEGRIVTVGKGTKVTVEEVIQPGWVLTTDQVQIKNLTESRLYRFEFGNYNPALATTTGLSNTAQQPSTGTPTGLTAGVILVGLAALVIKSLF